MHYVSVINDMEKLICNIFNKDQSENGDVNNGQ